jgi:Uma2 family endonuclease
MSQAEFHRRYQAYSEDEKWELIGGTVYMASPLCWPHGLYHVDLAGVLWWYTSQTPGVEAGDNATAILGEESEPQPDLALRIKAEYGGRSSLDSDQYVVGPSELIAEIAHSSRGIDLYGKRDDYQKAGVVEYLVLLIEEKQLRWTHFPSGRPIKANREGVFRSRIFPGLWLNGPALLARDTPTVMATLQRGLSSTEHARFVRRLQTAFRRHAT